MTRLIIPLGLKRSMSICCHLESSVFLTAMCVTQDRQQCMDCLTLAPQVQVPTRCVLQYLYPRLAILKLLLYQIVAISSLSKDEVGDVAYEAHAVASEPWS